MKGKKPKQERKHRIEEQKKNKCKTWQHNIRQEKRKEEKGNEEEKKGGIQQTKEEKKNQCQTRRAKTRKEKSRQKRRRRYKELMQSTNIGYGHVNAN